MSRAMYPTRVRRAMHPTRVRRAMYPTRVRRLLALLAACCLVALGTLAAPATAHAVPGDQIERYDIAYTITPQGTVQVSETIDLTFGGSNRHGFERTLVTRERWNAKEDAVYSITGVSVTSPTGAPTAFTQRTGTQGSDATLAIRIGDPDRTVDSRETYVLKYTIGGAMRAFDDHDEFAWDATGFEWTMPIRNITVQVASPQPPKDTICFAGPVGTKTPCTSKSVADKTATFRQASLPQGQNLSVAVSLPKGAVADPNPHLVPNQSARTQEQLTTAGIATGATAVVAPLLGWLFWRRRGRDDRFVGLAPGTVPAPGQPAQVGPSGSLNVPVAFSPPPIPVGEAGLLIDGSVDVRDTTATMIDLAVRGAMTLADAGKSSYVATLRDPSVARAPHEVVLLTELFGGRPPGATATIGKRGTLTRVHDDVARSLRSQVTERGWFHSVPGGRSGRRLAAGSVWGFIVMAFVVFPQLLGGLAKTLSSSGGTNPLMFVLPVVPIVLTIIVVRYLMRRGRRTATGRAVTDQIEGFRTYLATAEANQLRFEEGEDIFSKYLPWAIMLDLAERWASLCEQLVAQGRIPEYHPTWYSGGYRPFDVVFIGNALDTASLPEVSTGSSGSGFGGGSSFGGGGFSGSGGGGGGGSTW